MIISHDLLPAQKRRKQNLKVNIDVYQYATELIEELDALGIVERMKDIPQLGVIKVTKRLEKSRYDYTVLQLYFHQLIKTKLNNSLKLTYNSTIKAQEFGEAFTYTEGQKAPSIGDILQLLTLVYNIGHFYNTFTSSRAITLLANQDEEFKSMIFNAVQDERFTSITRSLLDSQNYQRFHLINSFLILRKCNQNKPSVALATEILHAYLREEDLPVDAKLHYAFSIFRKIRKLSYMAYDLQISNTPITVDLNNESAMLLLLRELLSEYNNNLSSIQMVDSIGKLLDDSIYNENSNAICYYRISKRIIAMLIQNQNFANVDYYDEYFLPKESVLNKPYPQKRDYEESSVLKLTFRREDRIISSNLRSDLERINNTRVGYYDRYTGEQTVLVSIKKKCEERIKRIAALKVLRCTIGYLRRICDIKPNDTRYLLCAKFFLFYFYREHPVIIRPTIDSENCVVCTRGKRQRIESIDRLIRVSSASEDDLHEVAFLSSCLKSDTINDTSICIPASVLVYEKEAVNREFCQFDGMIIHPMRKHNQVILMEAKNTSRKPGYGKKCLRQKLNKLELSYNTEDIQIVGHDARIEITI